MNDLWLFLGIILFLFVLWVYSGGPNNPISFAGPYITPVTAPGTTQVGYGPSANTFYRSANPSPAPATPAATIDAARSPYEDDVSLSYSDFRSNDEESEYVHIHLNRDQDVDITGWQLVGAKSGTHVRIPEGSRGSSSSKRDIELSDNYRDAYIISGPRGSDSIKYLYNNAWRAFLGNRDDIWRDSSDTVTLLDQNGKVVDQYSY